MNPLSARLPEHQVSQVDGEFAAAFFYLYDEDTVVRDTQEFTPWVPIDELFADDDDDDEKKSGGGEEQAPDEDEDDDFEMRSDDMDEDVPTTTTTTTATTTTTTTTEVKQETKRKREEQVQQIVNECSATRTTVISIKPNDMVFDAMSDDKTLTLAIFDNTGVSPKTDNPVLETSLNLLKVDVKDIQSGLLNFSQDQVAKYPVSQLLAAYNFGIGQAEGHLPTDKQQAGGIAARLSPNGQYVVFIQNPATEESVTVGESKPLIGAEITPDMRLVSKAETTYTVAKNYTNLSAVQVNNYGLVAALDGRGVISFTDLSRSAVADAELPASLDSAFHLTDDYIYLHTRTHLLRQPLPRQHQQLLTPDGPQVINLEQVGLHVPEQETLVCITVWKSLLASLSFSLDTEVMRLLIFDMAELRIVRDLETGSDDNWQTSRVLLDSSHVYIYGLYSRVRAIRYAAAASAAASPPGSNKVRKLFQGVRGRFFVDSGALLPFAEAASSGAAVKQLDDVLSRLMKSSQLFDPEEHSVLKQGTKRRLMRTRLQRMIYVQEVRQEIDSRLSKKRIDERTHQECMSILAENWRALANRTFVQTAINKTQSAALFATLLYSLDYQALRIEQPLAERHQQLVAEAVNAGQAEPEQDPNPIYEYFPTATVAEWHNSIYKLVMQDTETIGEMRSRMAQRKSQLATAPLATVFREYRSAARSKNAEEQQAVMDLMRPMVAEKSTSGIVPDNDAVKAFMKRLMEQRSFLLYDITAPFFRQNMGVANRRRFMAQVAAGGGSDGVGNLLRSGMFVYNNMDMGTRRTNMLPSRESLSLSSKDATQLCQAYHQGVYRFAQFNYLNTAVKLVTLPLAVPEDDMAE